MRYFIFGIQTFCFTDIMFMIIIIIIKGHLHCIKGSAKESKSRYKSISSPFDFCYFWIMDFLKLPHGCNMDSPHISEAQ